MKQDLQVKKFYHDVLFMASARQNKGKVFHINPTQFKILLKLVHYEKMDKNITFQNKDIAKHIYLAESTVKDAIEEIRKMGYITSELKKYNDRLGFKSKRTINLDWDFIQKLYDEYILTNSKIDITSSIPTEILSKTAIIDSDEIDPVITAEIIEPLKFEKLTSTTDKTLSTQEEITTVTEVAPVTNNKISTEETLLLTEVKSDKKIKEELEERFDIVKRKMAKNKHYEDYNDITEMEKISDQYSPEDLNLFLDRYENKKEDN
ncbi:hypothetical protein H4V97_003092 [Flavobacterium sp. CG_23.5]|uniref:hypothetical protein n=1 Tax=Flavobacterium sp. CG_23.5 TaxID=2760708 RepID=UPI001AE36EE1|nr:hypothetical protein [Flavobacterium sp. CG_23.5]MBP2284769.1 hypothetical protein [Flavobacterium sp. CG_23.5]MBP2284774.1 hypothetical protein [Flavobacterium sp. CG_23.5]